MSEVQEKYAVVREAVITEETIRCIINDYIFEAKVRHFDFEVKPFKYPVMKITGEKEEIDYWVKFFESYLKMLKFIQNYSRKGDSENGQS